MGDAAVIGVSDTEMGERVLAVVEALDQSAAGPDLATELIEFCRERLAHYTGPREVRSTPTLPRHDNGTLFKRLLREAYARSAGDPGTS